MSDTLLGFLNSPPSKPYVQSPVDDLESFFYITLWAVFNNFRIDQNDWQVDLNGNMKTRAYVVLKVMEGDGSFPTIVREAQKFLHEWKFSLSALRSDTGEFLNDPADRDKIRMTWHQFAVRGVTELLRLVKKHRDALRGFEELSDQGDLYVQGMAPHSLSIQHGLVDPTLSVRLANVETDPDHSHRAHGISSKRVLEDSDEVDHDGERPTPSKRRKID